MKKVTPKTFGLNPLSFVTFFRERNGFIIEDSMKKLIEKPIS